ncbi:unnamed protein product [Dicrocoelium dendriticum]|nr:unnamed protein product [Dicrocoelium dendriticum]
MIRRQNSSKTAKQHKSQRMQRDLCSRVGPNYQAEVPDFSKCNGDNYSNTASELTMWMPNKQPTEEQLQQYISYAANHRYTPEAAMLLLHWHDYNLSGTMDDMPNYVPISSKWTKCEVRKFLKCIDSKPRKNFVEARKTLPGRPMGDISQLYYSIAAPFKAPSRAKRHKELIHRCFTRAVRNNLICNRCSPTDAQSSVIAPGMNVKSHSRKPGEAEDPLDRQFELHLVDLVGMSETKRLLGQKMLCTPCPLLLQLSREPELNAPRAELDTSSPCPPPRTSSPRETLSNELCADTHTPLAPICPLVTDPIEPTNSSGSSSQLGSDSTTNRCHPSKHRLPPEVHYDHAEFLTFLESSEEQLALERDAELTSAIRLDAELTDQLQLTENRSRSLLHKMEALKPAGGFPEVSYRWSKTELALVLTAMSKYGRDFGRIARTIGSKTEGFVRDFYNQLRHRFPLDDIIRLSETNENRTQEIEVRIWKDEDSPCKTDSHPPCTGVTTVQSGEQTCINSESEIAPSAVSSSIADQNAGLDSSGDRPSQDTTNPQTECKEQCPVSEPPRRKRGRPPRNSSTSVQRVSESASISSQVRRGRGRPRRT